MTDSIQPKLNLIIDHAFVPCHFPEISGRGIPLCLNPTGWDGCHKANCGQSREKHLIKEVKKRKE